MTVTEAPPTPEASAASSHVLKGHDGHDGHDGSTTRNLALTWGIVGFVVMIASSRHESGAQSPLFVLAPLWIGIFTAVIPGEIGNSSLSFPRIHAFGAWMVAGGGLIAVLIPATDAAGLATNDELHYLGRGLGCIGLIAGAGTLLVTVVTLRRGVRVAKLPLLSWTALVTCGAIVIAVPAVAAGALLQYLAVRFNQDVSVPGLETMFGRPITYLGVLPGVGVGSAIVASATGKRLAGESAIKALLVVVAFLGVTSAVNNNDGEFARPGAIVLVPAMLIVLAWLGGLAVARRIPMRVGFFFVVAAAALAAAGSLNAIAGGTWTVARVDGAVLVAPLLVILGAAHELIGDVTIRPLSWASGIIAVPAVTLGGALLARRLVNGVSGQLVGAPTTSIVIDTSIDNLALAAVIVGCTFVFVDLILSGLQQRTVS